VNAQKQIETRKRGDYSTIEASGTLRGIFPPVTGVTARCPSSYHIDKASSVERRDDPVTATKRWLYSGVSAFTEPAAGEHMVNEGNAQNA
jgi:hypothetical protein